MARVVVVAVGVVLKVIVVVVGGCSDWSRLKIVASGLSSPSPSLGTAARGTVFEEGGLGEVPHLS